MKASEADTIPLILRQLAHRLGTVLQGQRLQIPEPYGSGYCTGFVFNPHIRMLISNYELKSDVMVNNPDIDTDKRTLFFKFQNIFSAEKNAPPPMPSVLIGTSRLHTDEVIAIHSHTATINIEVDAAYLKEVFTTPVLSPALQGLLQNAQPLLFEQVVYPSLRNIVDEIIATPTDGIFTLYFLRIKAEELICRLLMELDKRDEKQVYPLHSGDAQALYRVRDKMLSQPDAPPAIATLAAYAGMSPTKLKRLFKQVFGNSIFSYYQHFRMQEAARLLKEQNLPVAQVGYQLGFTNLSHFASVFKAHMGINPKQFSRT